MLLFLLLQSGYLRVFYVTKQFIINTQTRCPLREALEEARKQIRMLEPIWKALAKFCKIPLTIQLWYEMITYDFQSNKQVCGHRDGPTNKKERTTIRHQVFVNLTMWRRIWQNQIYVFLTSEVTNTLHLLSRHWM